MKLYPQWKEAVRLMIESGLTYGSTVSKSQVCDLLELKQPRTVDDVDEFNLAFLRGFTDIRTSLLENHKMLLKANMDGTYRVVMPEAQTDVVMRTGARAIHRELEKMADGLAFTNTDLLGDQSRRANADAQAKISKLAGIFQVEVPTIQFKD